MARIKATSNIDGIIVPKNPYAWATSLTGFERLVFTTSQNGADIREGSDGALPADFGDQVRQAFANVRTVLAHEGMQASDIVALHHCVVGRQDLAVLNRERVAFLGETRPATSFQIVAGLWNPDALYEVSVIAAR